jgi:hypothetical protein
MRCFAIVFALSLLAALSHAQLTVKAGKEATVADGTRVFLSGRLSPAPKPELKVEGLMVKVGSPGKAEAMVRWGDDAFLCRMAPGPDANVVQLSIGRVRSRLAHSIFSPSRDDGVTFEGENVELTPALPGAWRLTADRLDAIRVEHNVYKVGRGLKWFTPYPNKRVFSRATAGWCSWYYYYQGISEDEVVKNTEWLAKHLKPFGCEVVQIDDGWQGVGHGNGENRDWFVTDKRFPHGMKWLADQIRAQGFVPGIWLCAFGQSDTKLFQRDPSIFVRREDGSTVGEENGQVNWVGHYLVDPTGPDGKQYLHKLFNMLCNEWGYDYVKIDGQGGMAGTYEANRAGLFNRNAHGDEAYRQGVEALRDVMGYQRYLLCCGGGWDAIGLFDGCRIGGDVGASWDGMQPAIECTMRWLYQNNIAWYTDPDALCVRPPLTLDQARLWTTLLGLTGQMTLASDKMYDLPEERVELLRRVFPVADIRPMDLYPYRGRPQIFDLKVARDWGAWDVVALFNWSPHSSRSVTFGPATLGLDPGRYLYYDVWGKQLLAVGDAPLVMNLAPTSCEVVLVRALEDHPQLIASSRHLTQGADDLSEVKWVGRDLSIRGQSNVVGGDPYELRFTLPPGWQTTGATGEARGSTWVLTLKSDTNRSVPWRVSFARTEARAVPPPAPAGGKLTAQEKQVALTWQPAPSAMAYLVYRNDELIGVTADTTMTDTPHGASEIVRYGVAAAGWAGRGSARTPLGEFTTPPARDAWLDELAPISAGQEWGELRKNTSAEGNRITLAGKTFDRGLGTHARSEIVYDAAGYRLFEAEVGVDAEKGGAGSVTFEVWLDGKRVYDSGVMTGHEAAKKLNVPLNHNREMRLVVTDAGDGINCDHADWANARLLAQ